jgi:hypothetical protein
VGILTAGSGRQTQGVVQGGAELGVRRVGRRRQSPHHQPRTTGKAVEPFGHQVPQPAADTVADHGPADRPGHHEPGTSRGGRPARLPLIRLTLLTALTVMSLLSMLFALSVLIVLVVLEVRDQKGRAPAPGPAPSGAERRDELVSASQPCTGR